MNMPATIKPPFLKHMAVDFKLDASNEADGTFSGYLAVYGSADYYGDIIRKGAFKASLREQAKKSRKFPVLWQHDWNEVIGVFESLEERDDGLYVTGRLLIKAVRRAAEAFALMAAEAISGLSIGFEVITEKANKDGTYELVELALWEGSVVTFPAHDDARIDTVKSVLKGGSLPSLSQFEDFLREAGFSKTQASAVASKGLSHLLRRGEPGSEKAIERSLSAFAALKLTP